MCVLSVQGRRKEMIKQLYHKLPPGRLQKVPLAKRNLFYKSFQIPSAIFNRNANFSVLYRTEFMRDELCVVMTYLFIYILFMPFTGCIYLFNLIYL